MSLPDRPRPAPGNIYQHFKGNSYRVWAIASIYNTTQELVIYAPVYLPPVSDLPFVLATHTETEQKYLVKYEQGRWIAYSCGKSYTYSSGGFWARPIENFLAILGEEPVYYYRFLKVAEV